MQPVFINDRVEKIRNDEKEINIFIEEYKPFIASCTEKVAGRYVRYGEDDELSIALMAFAEAIKAYDNAKGSFLSFAQNVIKRRIIDYYRKENHHKNIVFLNAYSANEEMDNDLSAGDSVDKYNADEISEYRRLEIEELKKELLQWGISFIDLADASPKHGKTRKMCADISKFISLNSELVKMVRCKKQLPMAEIEKCLKIPRKKIERVRKYIIAVVIIMTGDYQYIKDYVDWGWRNEGACS